MVTIKWALLWKRNPLTFFLLSNSMTSSKAWGSSDSLGRREINCEAAGSLEKYRWLFLLGICGRNEIQNQQG